MPVILHLALFKLFTNIYCWPEQFIPWTDRECNWSNFCLEVADQSMFTSKHTPFRWYNDVCYVWGLPYKLYDYKILCSFYTEIDIPTLKYLVRYTGLNSIFDCIKQLHFSSRCLICWFTFLAGSCRPYSLLMFI